MDAVKRFTNRAFAVSGAILGGAALASPLWAWGRPDRALGFALGAAAGLARFAWSVRLARRLEWSGPRRHAAERVAGLGILAAALVAAGAVDGIDLAACAAGVFVASAATVAAALLEVRHSAGDGQEHG